MHTRLLILASAALVFLRCSVGWAAPVVVYLKNGQRVEGEFAGATATDISVRIGAQQLKLPITDLASVSFDRSSASVPTPKAAKSPDFNSDAPDALAALKAIQSATEVGVNLQTYSTRVADAKIKVESLLTKYPDAATSGAGASIQQAMCLYAEESRAWSLSITQPTAKVAVDSCLRKCVGVGMQDPESGIYEIAHWHAPATWSCASVEIASAEKALADH